MGENSTSFIGCRISLISKAKIRYEGVLTEVDSTKQTISLAQVRVFGTEERNAAHPVPSTSSPFDFIMFRSSDIADIQVCEPPKFVDPAIIATEDNTSQAQARVQRESPSYVTTAASSELEAEPSVRSDSRRGGGRPAQTEGVRTQHRESNNRDFQGRPSGSYDQQRSGGFEQPRQGGYDQPARHQERGYNSYNMGDRDGGYGGTGRRGGYGGDRGGYHDNRQNDTRTESRGYGGQHQRGFERNSYGRGRGQAGGFRGNFDNRRGGGSRQHSAQTEIPKEDFNFEQEIPELEDDKKEKIEVAYKKDDFFDEISRENKQDKEEMRSRRRDEANKNKEAFGVAYSRSHSGRGRGYGGYNRSYRPRGGNYQNNNQQQAY